jgi:regulatory protein
LSAARAYLAERTAMGYLSRAEQCRFALSMKLEKKGFSRDEIAPALDRLCDLGFLDDARFAEAWLRNRSIHQSEGRQKLLAGLRSRGIGSADAKLALDRFFDATEEAALCKRAVAKLRRLGKDENALTGLLMKKGFSAKIIREILLQNGENEIY